MGNKNAIGFNLTVSGEVTVPDAVIEKIADGLAVTIEDIIRDAPTDFRPLAQEYANAARQRQSEREPGPTPGPAFDFASLIGLCERKTDDIELQGRLNADRIALALSGLSAFGIGRAPTDADVAKYRDALRRYSATLDELNTKNKKLH